MKQWFNQHQNTLRWSDHIADRVAAVACSFSAFMAACLVVLVWGISGPYFHFSDTWQLVINTGTTIVTFLMAFLIGSNQVRQSERDRIQAQHDYETNLKAKEEIEDLQKAHVRLENKLTAVLALLSTTRPE